MSTQNEDDVPKQSLWLDVSPEAEFFASSPGIIWPPGDLFIPKSESPPRVCKREFTSWDEVLATTVKMATGVAEEESCPPSKKKKRRRKKKKKKRKD